MAALNLGFQCNWLQYDPQYDEMPVSIDMLTPFPESGDDSVGTKHSKTEKVVKK